MEPELVPVGLRLDRAAQLLPAAVHELVLPGQRPAPATGPQRLRHKESGSSKATPQAGTRSTLSTLSTQAHALQ